MRLYLLLCISICSLVCSQHSKPLLWFNFNNNGILSVIDDKSRINPRVFLESINNNDHFMSIGYVHLKNNYLKSATTIEKIKKHIIETNELSIKITLKSSKTNSDIFCLFCIISDNEYFGVLDTTIKDCSNINFGVIIIKNIIMIINRDTHSLDCHDSSIQTIIPSEKKQTFLFQMNKTHKKIYMNDRLLLETTSTNDVKDISNWNDDYKIFIGKSTHKRSNSYINIIDVIIWNEIVPFNIINSYDSVNPTKPHQQITEPVQTKNKPTEYYENGENNNYRIMKWIANKEDSIFIDPTKMEDMYVMKSSCSVDYMDSLDFVVMTYYNKENMYVQMRSEYGSKELDPAFYTSKITEEFVFNKKDNMRFTKIKYLIHLKESLANAGPITFYIGLYSKTNDKLLFRYPCMINTMKKTENGNFAIMSVVDSVKIMNIKVEVIDFFIKNHNLHIDFTTEFDNHFNRDVVFENETIVESGGYPMKIVMVGRNKEKQKWRMFTNRGALKNFVENEYASLSIIYFFVKDIGIVVKTQLSLIVNDFASIKRTKNIYKSGNMRRFRKNNEKRNIGVVESFYSDSRLTKKLNSLFYTEPIYMTISAIDKNTNYTQTECNNWNTLLQVKKIILQVEKSNGIHHYDITNSIHQYDHEMYKNLSVCLSTTILSFKLNKFHLEGSLPLKEPFFSIEWKFVDDASIIKILPKKHDPDLMYKIFDGVKKSYIHKTRNINVRCCPLWECGLHSSRCIWDENKEIFAMAFLASLFVLVLIFFVLYIRRVCSNKKVDDYEVNNYKKDDDWNRRYANVIDMK